MTMFNCVICVLHSNFFFTAIMYDAAWTMRTYIQCPKTIINLKKGTLLMLFSQLKRSRDNIDESYSSQHFRSNYRDAIHHHVQIQIYLFLTQSMRTTSAFESYFPDSFLTTTIISKQRNQQDSITKNFSRENSFNGILFYT